MAEQQDFLTTEHVWVPMPDGVRLSARLWLPKERNGGGVPVVLEYIPYRKRDAYRIHDNSWGAALASRGIAYARVDVRGTGDSEGTITDEYSEQELADGEACIEWLSVQHWCNGRVGMRGISWGAINTLQIAARNPPALKAIMPIAGTDNRYTDDAHYVGGLLGRPNMDWGILLKIVLAGPPDPAVVGDAWFDMWQARLEAAVPVIAEWIRHQRFDDYWRRGSICEDYAAIRCPVYLVAGWYDTYVNFVGRTLAALTVPKKGLIGPWGHTYPELPRPGGLDWATEETRWWRHWLLDEPNDIMAEPVFRAFLPYATPREVLPDPIPGRWIEEPQWPIDDPAVRTLWLNASGLSDVSEPGAVLSCSSAEPVGSCNAEWLDVLPAEQSHDDALSLSFDTERLAEAVEVLGYSTLRLRVMADQPAAAVVARLVDVDEEDRSWLVSYGVLNLTHRRGHDRPEALVPGEMYDVRLDLHLSAHRFERGHRIRIALSAGLWPLVLSPPGTAVLGLSTGECALELPIRAVDPVPGNFPLARNDDPGSEPVEIPPVTRDADGTLRYERHQPPFSYQVPEVDTMLTSETSAGTTLGTDGTSFWQHHTRREWRRDDWHCELEAGCEVHACDETLIVREYLRAYRSEALIYEQDETAELPREFV